MRLLKPEAFRLSIAVDIELWKDVCLSGEWAAVPAREKTLSTRRLCAR